MALKTYGIDFGTSTIKIYKKNEGIVLDERNIIAISDRKNIIATGNDAYEMYEKAPANIFVTYPVRSGVIADIANMLALLNRLMMRVNGSNKFSNADFIVATPTDITEVEKRSFFDLIANSNIKARKIKIVEKPIADALGAGLDVMNAKGVMTVDIGADTTEVSIISLGGIVLSKMIPVGGNRLDESIKNLVKKKYNLYIGDKTAEKIKQQLACALPSEETHVNVCGRDVVTGLPTKMEINSTTVYEAIVEYLYNIIDAIKIILERTPPEISSDIIDSGIFVTGGSANIKSLDQLIHQETDLKVNICENSANTVVNGLGKIMEDSKLSCLASNLRQTTIIN